MARIQMENVTKRYDRREAIRSLSLDVQDNEFFVLFGPAGAGKTTTLKCIAGIEFPQEGLVKIGGEIVNLIEPSHRNVSMVFENYALYPHLTVYDNMASPLRSKRYRQDEASIRKAIDKIAGLMKIDELYDRKPSQLSNGQRQRVAIGRCLVRKPNVFLMDEPLAHLDAKLKHLMRTELKEMQSAFNTTTIYVTHDYVEAMSLSDRIAVMDGGEIRQIGTALEMYYTPNSEFIAKLFGEPEINIAPAEFAVENGRPVVHTALGMDFTPPDDVAAALQNADTNRLHIGVRGGDISFALGERPGDGWAGGTVYTNEPIGNKVIMTVSIGETQLRVVAPNDTRADIDQPVFVRPDFSGALYFGRETGRLITRHNRQAVTRPGRRQAKGEAEPWQN